MRLISTTQIQSDMVLARPIYSEGCLILANGTNNLERYIRNLNRLGIFEIYVEDDISEGITIPDVITSKTRNICKETLRTAFKDFTQKGILQVDTMQDVIDHVINEILENQDVLISLNDIGAADEYTYTHSVSTTVYALMLGQRVGYKEDMLKRLAMGTILHDIGKIYIDRDIMFKEGKLTDKEYEYVKKHTILGYNALKGCKSLSELSRIISLTHHEHVDGTGYPRGLQGDELHTFSKIVAVADVYDALTSTRCYRAKWSNRQAMDMLMQSCGTKFETELVCQFLHLIAVFPNGTQVRLSDGRIGIVKEQNPGMPLRPMVRILQEADGTSKDIYDVNLMTELNIVIAGDEFDYITEDKSKQVG
ncbi:HD-GYP domain-containing protein [Anaerosporobacter faecicola]|uniref:HD-GYP domain-containing protein n=1 Tax=Anaerosporobacter faecicola TaxID=2718714 RepID=UPI0014395571|nr:HD-GYP domain-containing protein [Anaerosporobacter faecicola]